MTQSTFSAPLRLIVAVLTATWVVLVVGAYAARASERVAPLPVPTKPVVLSIQGNIQNANTDMGPSTIPRADFDMEMLMTMPSTRIETSTPWTDGVTRFEGVLVKDLMERVAAQGTQGEFSALNDYTVRISLEDLSHFNAIIAYRMNGKPMRVRTKGPLWLIYPMDDFSQLQTAQYRDHMIWQLRTIFVK